jgi:hypothetical protein
MNRIKFAGLKLISAQPLRTPGGLDFTLIGFLYFQWGLGRPWNGVGDGQLKANTRHSLAAPGLHRDVESGRSHLPEPDVH